MTFFQIYSIGLFHTFGDNDENWPIERYDISQYLRKNEGFPQKTTASSRNIETPFSAGCPGHDVTDQQKPTYDL